MRSHVIAGLVVLITVTLAWVPLNTPRLEEFLSSTPPRLNTNTDSATLDVLLDQDGNQQDAYNKAFKTIKDLHPQLKTVTLDGGFFYKFDQFGKQYLEKEIVRVIDGINAIVRAAQSNGLKIEKFRVRVQFLMYYTIDHDTYDFRALLARHFHTEVSSDDYADFRTVLAAEGVQVKLHVELQFDPRRNRHQPDGRAPQNPRKGEVVADRSSAGHKNVFWLEDMAYVAARRARLDRLPLDFVFFSPIRDFVEPPARFYDRAVKKMATLFEDNRPLRLFGSAVFKGENNTKNSFEYDWNLAKESIDAVFSSLTSQNYPVQSAKVKLYFMYGDKATSNWSDLLMATYGKSADGLEMNVNSAKFVYAVGVHKVHMEIYTFVPVELDAILDNTKLRQSPLFLID